MLKTTLDSLVYDFTLSNLIDEDVEVRLHSENGKFDIYLGRNYIPDPSKYLAEGDDHQPIIFRQEQA